MTTITYTGQLVTHVCWCGIHHAIPAALDRQASTSGHTVYCPLGHRWVVRETELDKLKKQVARQTAQLDQERAQVRTLEASRSALKGQITKAKKRAAAGVCPCCNRTFQNVARHMAGQHPDFAEPEGQTPV